MMRFGRFALIGVPTLILLLTPSAARAQRFVAFAGGVNASQGPVLPLQSVSAGVAGQASFGYRVAPRLRMRFDAIVSHFTAASQQVYYAPPCPSNASSCGGVFAAPRGGVGVAGLTMNELI